MATLTSEDSSTSSRPPSPSTPQSPALHPLSPQTNHNPHNQRLASADADIAHALVAWLVSLSAVPPNATFGQLATNCTPLCAVFSHSAPSLLPISDFFRIPPSSHLNNNNLVTNQDTSTDIDEQHDENNNLDIETNNCVTVGPPTRTRNQRYNSRRLARSLATFFKLRVRKDTSNSSSTSASSTASSQLSTASEDPLSASSPDPDPDSVDATATTTSSSLIPILPSSSSSPISTLPHPRLTTRYADALLTLAEDTFGEQPDALRATLTLAECTLCAATNGAQRDTYIQAVLTLPQHMQELLAVSMSRTMQGSVHYTDHDHNNMSISEDRPPLQDSSYNQQNDENRPMGLAQVSGMDDRGFIGGINNPSGHNHTGNTPAIPLAEYKNLVGERDALRRKLNVLLAEVSQSQDHETRLRKDLEDARDQARQVDARYGSVELELADANRKLKEAEEKAHEAKVNVEEHETLRTKAQRVDELQESLNRVNSRLQEMDHLRTLNADLEDQVLAFRENENKLSKQSIYLEDQLKRTTERADQMSTVLDNLSKDLDEKESKLTSITEENEQLKSKIIALNNQLELAVQAASISASKGATSMTTRSNPSPKSSVQTGTELPQHSPNVYHQTTGTATTMVVQARSSEMRSTTTGTQMVASEDGSVDVPLTSDQGVATTVDEQFDQRAKKYVSDLLLDVIGVRVGWEDIVECIRGVMDAMRDIEQSAEMEHRAAAATPSVPDSPLVDRMVDHVHHHQQQQKSSMPQRARSSYEGFSRLRNSGTKLRRARNSQMSSRSDGRVESTGTSEGLSRLSIVPDFEELDEKLKRNRGVDGDEFDHAANHINVAEYPANGGTPSNSGGSNKTNDLDHETVSYTESGTYDDELTTTATTNEGEHSGTVENASEIMMNSASLNASGSKKFDIEQNHNNNTGIRSDAIIAKAALLEDTSAEFPTHGSELSISGGFGSNKAGGQSPQANNMSLTVRGSRSRSTSHHSETTSMIARQTRSDLVELKRAMEAMRLERQSCASVNALVQKLEGARIEVDILRRKVAEYEREGELVRSEVNSMLKEMDNAELARQVEEKRNRELIGEKDRLIAHLESAMKVKEEESRTILNKLESNSRELEKMKGEEKGLREKLESARVIERAHEVEIAKLKSRIEAHDSLGRKLSSMVRRTEGLTNEVKKHRDSEINEMVETARKDKEAALAAREEAKRVAKTNESVLEDMRASAAAVAMHRTSMIQQEERPSSSRRSTRFLADFWRRLLNRDRVSNVDFNIPNSFSKSSPTLANVGNPPVEQATPGRGATPTPKLATTPRITRNSSLSRK